MKNFNDFDRDEKVVFYCIYALENLKKAGFVEGGEHKFSKKGERIAKQMIESGFRPTDEELKFYLSQLVSNGHEDEIINSIN